MAADFPTTIHLFTDVACDDTRNQKDVVNELQDEVGALEVKVGVDGSAVNTTHDYKLSGVADGDKAMSLTGTETATNKTFTSPKLNSPKINEEVAITATSTEINKVDGFDGDATDLNKIYGVTDGAATASKAVVLDASKDFDFGTGDITATDIDSSGDLGIGGTWNIGGTAVNATAAELNITDGGETTEKVLNVQAKARAYRATTDQSINTATFTKVQLNAETFDVGSDFDSTTNYQFVAPVTGYYCIMGGIRIADVNAGTEVFGAIYVNSAAVTYASQFAQANGNDPRVFVGGIEYVTSGQAIELYVSHNHGSARNLTNGTNNTWMSVHLLSV